MYLVNNPSLKTYRVINYDDFTVLESLYKGFLDVDVVSSWYPKRFLKTLDFTDNVCEISYADIQSRFCKWCLQEGKSYYCFFKTKLRSILPNKIKYLKTPAQEQLPLDTTEEPVPASTYPEPVQENKEPVEEPEPASKDPPPTSYTDAVRQESAPIETPTEQESKGIPVFSKKKLSSFPVLYERIEKEEEKDLEKVYNNGVKDSMLMVCFTENNRNGITFFDSSDVFMLKELENVGLKDVKINFAMYLPNKDIVEELAYYYALDAPHDMQNNISSILKLVKFVNSEKKVTVLVKSVMEFFYNTYEFDINSTTNLQNLFGDFYKYNTGRFRFALNAVLNIDTFVDILKYLYMFIEDNQLMYYKPRQVPLNMSLDFDKKLEAMLKTPYTQQKTHQLRREPQCKPLSNISPWGMSPHLEYTTSETLIQSRSLNI